MHGSNPSDGPEDNSPERTPKGGGAFRAWLRRNHTDVLALVGALSIAAGGWLFHPGLGLILLGFTLVLIGTRGAAASGG
jgi:hypothetical protein